MRGIEEVGMAASLVGECAYWVVMGRLRRQPVRFRSVVVEMMDIGIRAIPIVGALAVTIGVMLAIQGIHTLRTFGAESRVTLGVALSIVREFAPLITGMMVAGRSGSALAARLGTMKINQEVDALHVMGINPIRFLVAPALFACLVMLPALTFFSMVAGLWAAGAFISLELNISFASYVDELISILSTADLMHGLGKSAIFAVLIVVIGAVNGSTVTGGAEGVGRATTRAVVQALSAIVITDMLFVFAVTR